MLKSPLFFRGITFALALKLASFNSCLHRTNSPSKSEAGGLIPTAEVTCSSCKKKTPLGKNNQPLSKKDEGSCLESGPLNHSDKNKLGQSNRRYTVDTEKQCDSLPKTVTPDQSGDKSDQSKETISTVPSPCTEKQSNSPLREKFARFRKSVRRNFSPRRRIKIDYSREEYV